MKQKKVYKRPVQGTCPCGNKAYKHKLCAWVCDDCWEIEKVFYGIDEKEKRNKLREQCI